MNPKQKNELAVSLLKYLFLQQSIANEILTENISFLLYIFLQKDTDFGEKNDQIFKSNYCLDSKLGRSRQIHLR